MDVIELDMFDDLDVVELIEFGVPRQIYNRSDHFNSLDDYEFFKKFRLTKETVMDLLLVLENELEFPYQCNKCISPINQLLTCLRYYATGSHLDVIADFMRMHSTTAIRIIPKVSMAIARLYNRFIKLPDTEEKRTLAKRSFYEIARFPHVIGALDCTHVKIQSPGGDDAEVYRNRKNYFSINVQAVCDANLKFIDIVARWPGSSHDVTVFNSSNLRTRFETGQFPDCILLGDGGYPIRGYLLTPLLNPTTEAEQLYNQSHIRTRNKIECCFGVLKRRSPVLAYGCRLKLRTTLIVIVAAAVLHNVAREMHEPQPPADDDIGQLNQIIIDGEIPPVIRHENATATTGSQLRRMLIDNYFAQL